MNIFTAFCACLGAVCGLGFAGGAGAPVEAKERVIFDGKSLAGWEHVGPGKMTLADGMMKTEGGMGLLWYSKERLGDCVIKVVYKTDKKTANAGVYVRIADKPDDPWFAVHHGYEVQICDEGDDYHATGAIYSLSKISARPFKPVGEWNTMEITLKGKDVFVAVNGKEVNRFNSETSKVPERKQDYEPERGPRPEHGYIGLQNHDDASGHVYYKEVSVRSLKD